ncbi:MAG: ATP-binding protein, partial [Nitrososphaera sp.]|nr:ATP-binding protein [Nitrososphaera sp.]
MAEPFRIHKNLDEGPRPGWKLFLYGDWGSGKTVLARGAPNSLLIDTEGSRTSLRNHPELAVLPYVNAENPEELLDVCDRISKKNSPGMEQFDTYIIDTVSATRSTTI